MKSAKTNQTLRDNINSKRKEFRLKITDLAKKSGVSDKTLRKILDGTTQNPTITNISKLATALDTTTSELMGEKQLISQQDKNLISQFERLNETGKEAVIDLIGKCIVMQSEKPMVERQLPLFEQSVSTGLGNYLDSSNYGYVSVPIEEVPEEKGFVLQVIGDSMEPLLFDKDYIYIEPVNDLNIGEIGVFVINGESQVKQLVDDQLISLNTNYPPMRVSDMDEVKLIGRFIKKMNI